MSALKPTKKLILSGVAGIFIALVTAPLAANATGAPVPVGTPFQIDSVPATSVPSTAVAYGTDGTFIAAWSKSVEGGGQGVIHVRRFASDGNPSGAEILVSDGTAYSQKPVVAIDGMNNFVVGWIETLAASGIRVPKARLYWADGTPRGESFCVDASCDSKASTTELSLAADNDGDFVFTWTAPSVKARRFAADGTPKETAPFTVFSFPLVGAISVSMNKTTGAFAVAALRVAGFGIPAFAAYATNTVAQRYTAAGKKQGSRINVQSCSYYVTGGLGSGLHGCGIFNVAMLVDDSNAFEIVSEVQASDGVHIVAQRYSSKGAAVGEKIQVTPAALDTHSIMEAASGDGAGNFVVLWYDGGNPSRVMGQALAADGTLRGEPFQIPDNDAGSAAGGSDSVPIAMNSSGDFIVIWSETAYDTNVSARITTIKGQSYTVQ